MICRGESYVVLEEASEFPGECGGKLRTTVRDDGVVEAESFEHMIKKNLCYSCGINGLGARSEDYPLRKPMVYYDHNRVMALGGGKVGDEIDRQLFEGQGDRQRDRIEGGNRGVCVDFVLLTDSASINKVFHERREAWPPVIAFEESFGTEDSHMTRGGGGVNGME